MSARDLSAGTSEKVARFSHGSRVPGWDTVVDLEKDPSEVPDPAVTPVPPELREAIEAAMARYPDRRSAIIPALHAAQRHHGWCSPEAIDQVACVMGLTPGYVAAVVTFYDMFSTEPKGRHDVFVCTNISCSLRGADAIFAALLDASGSDPDVNVRAFECLGACDIAPMASVDGVYVGPLEVSDTEALLSDIRAGRPVLDAKQLRHRASVDPNAGGEGARAPGGVVPAEGEGARAVPESERDPGEGATGPPMSERDGGGDQPASDHGDERTGP